MTDFESKLVSVDSVTTHYLEAGAGFPVILLHGGEFGACAELGWERNIAALAKHFRVIAPDWLGYGKTEKLFSFDNMWSARVDHMTRFLQTIGIERAHFVGNSMGGTILLDTAAKIPSPWPIEKLVAICGGGQVPDNEARRLLNTYDGTIEHMRKLVQSIFINPAIHADEEYIARRNELARAPGAWECTAAIRFKAPWRTPSVAGPPQADYTTIASPVYLITGARDNLREPNFGPNLQKTIPGSRLHIVERGGHCPQIDEPEEVNAVVLDYLLNN